MLELARNQPPEVAGERFPAVLYNGTEPWTAADMGLRRHAGRAVAGSVSAGAAQNVVRPSGGGVAGNSGPGETINASARRRLRYALVVVDEAAIVSSTVAVHDRTEPLQPACLRRGDGVVHQRGLAGYRIDDDPIAPFFRAAAHPSCEVRELCWTPIHHNHP